jgi:hypothetical protein
VNSFSDNKTLKSDSKGSKKSKLKSSNTAKVVDELSSKEALKPKSKKSRMSFSPQLKEFQSKELLIQKSQKRDNAEIGQIENSVRMLQQAISNLQIEQMNIMNYIKSMPEIISFKQIGFKIDESLIIFEKKIEAKITENYTNFIESKISEVKNEFEERLDSLNKNTNFHIASVKSKLTQMNQETSESLSDLSNSFHHLQSETHQKVARSLASMTSFQKSIEASHFDLKKKFSDTEGIWQNLNSYIKTFLDILKLKSLLDAQDEEDRHSIALWGMYERPTNSTTLFGHIRKASLKDKTKLSTIHPATNYNTISIDKTCYS